MQILKGIGTFVPVKYVAQFFLKRFVGKFVDEDRPIDLDQATFDGDSVCLRDLNLNCKVLNESLEGKTTLRFFKFRIGKLNINFQLGLKPKVTIEIDEVAIDMMPVSMAQTSSQRPQNKPPRPKANSGQQFKTQSRDREIQMVNEFIGNFLINLEATVTNVAVRILTREQVKEEDRIPTLLIRLTKLELKKKNYEKYEKFQSDIMNMLAQKCFIFGDLSVHLMNEQWLEQYEYAKEINQPNRLDDLVFPYTYPILNHPSTLLLMKGQKSDGSIMTTFTSLSSSKLKVGLQVGNIELICSLKQLKVLTQFGDALKPQAAPLLQVNLNQSANMSQEGDLSLSQSLMETSFVMRESFAQELFQNDELMKSINPQVANLGQSTGFVDQTEQPDRSTEIELEGEIHFNLIEFTLLCDKYCGAQDINEDRIFKVFNRDDKQFTSAHAYYQFSIKDILFQIRKSFGKELKIGMENLSNLQLTRFIQTTEQHSSEISRDLNDSVLFRTANEENEMFQTTNDQALVPFDLLDLKPASVTSYVSQPVIEIKNVSLMMQSSLQIYIAKIFAKVTTFDLLIALALQHVTQSSVRQTQLSQPQKKQKSQEIKIDIGGIELELALSKTCSYKHHSKHILPKEDLPQIYSIGINVFKIKFRNQNKQITPILTIEQIEIVAVHRLKKVTILSLNTIELEPIKTDDSNKTVLSSLADITQFMQQQEDLDSDEIDQQKVTIFKNTSSNSSFSNSSPPVFQFEMDQPNKSGLKVKINQISSEFDSKDLLFFTEFLTHTEVAVKHASNLADISTLNKTQISLVQQFQLQPTGWFQVQVEDLQIQVVSSVPILQIRLESLFLDIRMQKRSQTNNCIEIEIRLQNFLISDLMTTDIGVYVSHTTTTSAMPLHKQQFRSLQTSEDLIKSGRCLIHSSKPSLPILKAKIKICIIEESMFNDRIQLQELLLDPSDIHQLYADFSEMKQNPIQLQISSKVNFVNVSFTNQVKNLVEELLKLGNRLTTCLNKQRQHSDVKPTKLHKMSQHLVIRQLELLLNEFCLIYQPALPLDEIESYLGFSSNSTSQEVLKTCYMIAVKVQKLNLFTNTKDTHKLNCSLLQLLFLKENDPQNIIDWINFSECEQNQVEDLLAQTGFIPIVSLGNLSLSVKPSQVKLKLEQIFIDLCADTVRELAIFQEITQIAFTSQIDQIDQIIEQNVSNRSQVEEEFKSVSGIVVDEERKNPFTTNQIQNDNEIVIVGVNELMDMKDASTTGAHIGKFRKLQEQVDWNYFSSTKKSSKPNTKKFHQIPESLSKIEPTIEIQLILNHLRITLYAGSDLDFAIIPQEKRSQSQKKIQRSQSHQIHLQQNKSTGGGIHNLIDMNYINKNQDLSDQFQVEEKNRQRVKQRDTNRFIRLSITKTILTRRQFPIINQRKNKSLQFSVANVELSACDKRNAVNQLQMMETPFCFRHSNFFQLSIVSEKNYETLIEELDIIMGFRSIDLTVSPLPTEILQQFQKEAQPPRSQKKQQLNAQPAITQQQQTGPAQTKMLIKSMIIQEARIHISIEQFSSFLTFKKFTIQVRQFTLFTPTSLLIPQVLDEIKKYYKEQFAISEIIKQLFASNTIFLEIGRGVSNLMSPFYKPILRARTGSRGIIFGFGEGVKDLTGYLSEGTRVWGQYLLQQLND